MTINGCDFILSDVSLNYAKQYRAAHFEVTKQVIYDRAKKNLTDDDFRCFQLCCGCVESDFEPVNSVNRDFW